MAGTVHVTLLVGHHYYFHLHLRKQRHKITHSISGKTWIQIQTIWCRAQSLTPSPHCLLQEFQSLFLSWFWTQRGKSVLNIKQPDCGAGEEEKGKLWKILQVREKEFFKVLFLKWSSLQYHFISVQDDHLYPFVWSCPGFNTKIIWDCPGFKSEVEGTPWFWTNQHSWLP